MTDQRAVEKLDDSQSNIDLTSKLADEILTKILEEHLLLRNDKESKCRPVIEPSILDDVGTLSHSAYYHRPTSDLFDTYWFKFDVAVTGGICAGGQYEVRSLDNSALRVCRRWNDVGHGLLRREPNGFIEVSVSDRRFAREIEWFGLKVWSLEAESRNVNPAVKIQIQSHVNILQGVRFEGPSQFRYLLDLNDLNEFGRFLMLMTGKQDGWCEGKCLRIEILNHQVPGFCNVDNAFEKLFRDPFLAGLSDSIDQISVAPQLPSQDDFLKRLEVVKAEFTAYRRIHQRDMLNPANALSRLISQYGQAVKNNKPDNVETILRRILELSTTVLVSKFPEYRVRWGESDPREYNAKCFFLEVLRVAAYKMSGVQMLLAAGYVHKYNRHDHAMLALHCMSIALSASNVDIRVQPAWACQCYLELFVLGLCVEGDGGAWAAIERLTSLITPVDPQLPLGEEETWKRGEEAVARARRSRKR